MTIPPGTCYDIDVITAEDSEASADCAASFVNFESL
jgi:hypothetical protein